MGNHTVNKKERPDYIERAASSEDRVVVTAGIIIQTEQEIEDKTNVARKQPMLFIPENVIGETPEYMSIKIEEEEQER